MGTSRLRTPSGARLKLRDPEGVPAAAMATPKKFRRPGKISRPRRNFFREESRWLAIPVLQEAGAIQECEQHGWMQDRADPHAFEQAFDMPGTLVRRASLRRPLPLISPRSWTASAT